MKLPDVIEREIREIETALGAQGGQQAGPPRLRGLRSAIEQQTAELAAARAVLETSEIAWFFAKWPASKKSDQVAMLVDRAAWQAWQARAGKGQG
jgi:hypothetical protein